MIIGSEILISEGSGDRVEAFPMSLTPSSSKNIEDLQDGHSTSFVHLK
ncbi:MAG: hypothetical protein GXO60_04575 [Epsilonproteobacteria bacterium]|nr:hypothetical protein [Campylobacterota bacterium]